MATRAARSGSGTGGQPGAASSSRLVAGMRPVVASFVWPRWLMTAVGRCGCGCRTVWLRSMAGVYRQVLGPLHMAEPLPPDNKESRLVKERDKYWLTIPYPAQCDIETP